MVFKSAAPFARSAAAAKAAWLSGSSQPVPTFFVSTPQFQRQRSQVGPYRGEAHRSSNGVDTGFLLTCGSQYSTSAASVLDDDDRDGKGLKRVQRYIPVDLLKPSRGDGSYDTDLYIAETSTLEDTSVEAASDAETAVEGSAVDVFLDDVTDPVQDTGVVAIETSQDQLVQAATTKIDALQQAGAHSHVLETFADLETQLPEIPIGLYNQVLRSLAALGLEASNMSPLLQGYEQLLQRGALPTRETYSVIVKSLVDMAYKLADQRHQLALSVGTQSDPLESVQETIEALAVDDHIKLALNIYRASVSVDAGNFSQDTVDSLVIACARHTVSEGAELVPLASSNATSAVLTLAENLEALDSFFGSIGSPSSTDVAAYLTGLFKFGQPEAAVQYFGSLDSELKSQMVNTLISGFASQGYVATALRWFRENGNAVSAESYKLLSDMTAGGSPESFASIALFYERLAITEGAANSHDFAIARDSFLQLAVDSDSLELVLAVIKETSLRNSFWTPSTLISVSRFLVAKGHVELAVDVFVQQSFHLVNAWEKDGQANFIGQELMDDMISFARPYLNGSRGTALVMMLFRAAFLDRSFGARSQLLEMIWEARRNQDPVLVDALNSSKVLLADLVDAHSKWIVDSEGHMGLAMPSAELAQLKEMYPVFLSDLIENRVAVGDAQSTRVSKSLKLLELSSAPWDNYISNFGVSEGSFQNAGVDADQLVSFYAQTANGVDLAVEKLELMFLGRKLPLAATFSAVVDAAARVESASLLEKLDGMLDSYVDPSESNTAHEVRVAALDAFARAARIQPALAQKAYTQLLDLGSAPSIVGYTALLEHVNRAEDQGSRAAMLFNEASSRSVRADTDFSNACLVRLAAAKRLQDAEFVFDEMVRLSIPQNTRTIETAMMVSLQQDKVRRAIELLVELPNAGDYVAGARPYNMLMDYFVQRRKNRQDAIEVFDRLRASGATPTTTSYKLLMQAWLLSPHDISRADNVLAMIKEDGAEMSTVHFAELLRARGVLDRNLGSARDFYRGLVKNSRVRPDQHIFKALIESYVATGHTKDTPQVLDEMARYHVPVSQPIMDILLHGWSGEDAAKAHALQKAYTAPHA